MLVLNDVIQEFNMNSQKNYKDEIIECSYRQALWGEIKKKREMKWDQESVCHWQKASSWCNTSSMKRKHLKNRGRSTTLPVEIVKFWKISVKERSELEKKSETVSEKWISKKDGWSTILKEAEINNNKHETELTEKKKIFILLRAL